MKTEHTSGSWHIGKRTFAPYVYGPKGEEVAGPSTFTSGHDETLANARLIAAAPELLAALYASEIALRSVLHSNVQVDAAFEQVRKAIARATGAEAEGAK